MSYRAHRQERLRGLAKAGHSTEEYLAENADSDLTSEQIEAALENKINKVDPRDFVDSRPYGYDVATVQNDINHSRDRMRFFEQSSSESDKEIRRRSKIIEGVLAMAEDFDWLGPDSYIFATAEHDDLAGVDLIVEIETEEGESVTLALDATMAGPDIVAEKMDRIVADLLRKGKKEIKYFESEVSGEKGPLEVLPVVVGLEWGSAGKDIASKFAQMELARQSGATDSLRGTKEEIEKHPSQMIFIDEMISQMEFQIELLESQNDEGVYQEKINRIKKTLDIFREIRESKKFIIDSENNKDAVYSAILKKIESLRSKFKLDSI